MLEQHDAVDHPQNLAILRLRSGQVLPLPAQLTSFIGREREIAEVKQLLASSRLVTLTGAGGCGKTRLALRVASDLRDTYADGVRWVELAPLADATLLPQAIAKALNVVEQPGRALLDVILDFLHAKHLLLVLDNCEHLASACAEFAHDALCDAPQVTILATSREPLAVMGEMLYPVTPLALPPTAQVTDIAHFDSIRLFVERARDVLPNFAMTSANAQPVADICRRLDGIPLAIELASARVNALTVEQIAARLDGRFTLLTSARHGVPSHHRTLRAALDWSYDSLSAQEQTLLQRLSVFAGGFSLEAVEAVCSEQSTVNSERSTEYCPPFTVHCSLFDLLSSLVNKSLVVAETLKPGDARYRMLETIRQYAGDKLRESGEGEVIRNRHLDYFLKFAQDAEARLHSAQQYEWLERLDVDHDNLRAALGWSLGEGRVEKGLRLAIALLWYWDMRNYWGEGLEHTQRLLNQPEAAPKTLPRANALFVAARMISPIGDEDKSCRPYLEAAIAIAREQGNDGKRLLALCLGFLGYNVFGDDPAAGEPMVGEGLVTARTLGDEWILGLLLGWRGALFTIKQDYAAAQRALGESLSRFESVGDRHWAAIASNIIGWACAREGDLAQARQVFEKNLPFFRQTKDRHYLRMILNNLGGLARREERYDLAKKYCEEALEIARELGNKFYILLQASGLGNVALHDGDLDLARSLYAECLALASEMGRSPVAGLRGLARIAAIEKKARRAVRLFACAAAIPRTEIRPGTSGQTEIEIKRYLAVVREQLGDAEFNAAWEEGKQMTIEQAIEYALKDEPSPTSAPAPVLPRDPNALTPREVEVLRLVAAGLSDAQVAAKLIISRRTVSTHLTAIYGKLGVTSRSAATRCALERKLV
jgi:non-specific serine/threonine protein kinase